MKSHPSINHFSICSMKYWKNISKVSHIFYVLIFLNLLTTIIVFFYPYSWQFFWRDFTVLSTPCFSQFCLYSFIFLFCNVVSEYSICCFIWVYLHQEKFTVFSYAIYALFHMLFILLYIKSFKITWNKIFLLMYTVMYIYIIQQGSTQFTDYITKIYILILLCFHL